MKKITFLLAFVLLAFTSCSTDDGLATRGPQGPPGEDGLDGLGYTFEETVDLNYNADGNFYSSLIFISEEVETINPAADAVLVYRLETVEDTDGTAIDSWSLIPQNFFIADQGTIQYVFRHTVGDVEIFLEGNFDLSGLDSKYIENQTFRIVVVPSDFLLNSGVDVSSYDEVNSALELETIELAQ